MFQACFIYDFKGPCHIFYPKTLEQKEKNEKLIERSNEEEIEVECYKAFEKQGHEKERI